MPISGLVVTLAPPSADTDRAMAWLSEDTRFTLGQPEAENTRRLPITLDTASRAEDKQCWEEMQAHPGITFVDVACVFFDEDEDEDEIASPTNADLPHTVPTEPQPARSQPW